MIETRRFKDVVILIQTIFSTIFISMNEVVRERVI